MHMKQRLCFYLLQCQYEFRKHPKIKWLDGGLKPLTSGLPIHCSINLANLANFLKPLIVNMNVGCMFNRDVIIQL